MSEPDMIERVAAAVLSDLLDRRGIRHAFDDIDDDVMAEIRQAIGRAAITAMRKSGPLDERDAFEDWAYSDHRSVAPQEFEEREPENNHFYADDCDNQAYIGWCARAALSPTPPETKEME